MKWMAIGDLQGTTRSRHLGRTKVIEGLEKRTGAGWSAWSNEGKSWVDTLFDPRWNVLAGPVAQGNDQVKRNRPEQVGLLGSVAVPFDSDFS